MEAVSVYSGWNSPPHPCPSSLTSHHTQMNLVREQPGPKCMYPDIIVELSMGCGEYYPGQLQVFVLQWVIKPNILRVCCELWVMLLSLYPGTCEFLSGCDIPLGVLRDIRSFITQEMKGFWWTSEVPTWYLCPAMCRIEAWMSYS